MTLFDIEVNPDENLLPSDGTVYYYGKMLKENESGAYLNALLSDIEWRNDEAIIFGKKIITKRKVAWHGDKPYAYTYSKTTKLASPWSMKLSELKTKVEAVSGDTYNSCLLNLYHDGSEGMSWHSDDEKELTENGSIASLSLGVARKFVFKHKRTGQKVTMHLESGSLLVMKGETQTHWLHRLPPSKLIKTLRINLTFRKIKE